MLCAYFLQAEMMISREKRLLILLIEAGLPNPEFDAGSRALIDFIDIIKSGSGPESPNVHFLSMGHNSWGRESDLLERNVQIHAPQIEFLSTDGQGIWLDAIAPDIVVISRPEPAIRWLSTVKGRKANKLGTKFFYYGHDIHYQRLGQQLGFNSHPALERKQRFYKVAEHAIWDCFSVVIYGSKTECNHVNKIFPNKAVYLPLYITREKTRHPQMAANVKNTVPVMLWVGGAHHAPNRDGLSWLIKEIFSRIDASLVLSVVGNWSVEFRQGIDYQPSKGNHEVRWLAQLEQSQLENAYQTCDFAVATLRFGAGVKGKVFEAIARKCPVITTPIGAQGLEHLDWPELFLRHASAQAVAESLECLLKIQPRTQFENELQSMQSVLIHESKLAPLVWSALICSNRDFIAGILRESC